MIRPRYAPAALDAAIAFLAQLTSPDVSDLLGAIVEARAEGSERRFDLETLLAGTAMRGADGATRLVDALGAFRSSVGFAMGVLVDAADDAPPAMFLSVSDRLLAVLDRPVGFIVKDVVPEPDAATAVWVDAARDAIASGTGCHLALRCEAEGQDELRDFAALVCRGAKAARISDAASIPAAILQAELHAGERGGLVAVSSRLFAAGSGREIDACGFPASDERIEDLAADGRLATVRDAMRCVRNVYVWRVPATGALPRAVLGLVAGCVGPLRPDPAWNAFVAGADAPEAGPEAIAAVLGVVGDARAADGVLDMAGAIASSAGASLDDACRFVARSFGARRFPVPATGPRGAFDPRLVVADHDVGSLLARAHRLRALGCRILFCGPPGGGKSALAAELCRLMTVPGAAGPGARLRGDAPVSIVKAASLLVRDYGGTERILGDLFEQAAAAGGMDGGAPVLVDELDTFCGVREGGTSGGNAYLVRSLTNEWLRVLDAHPDVPVVATCNDPAAIDPAVLRRFAFVVVVAADLPPDVERLAWTSILGVEPPDGWLPIGASVSDIAIARARCAMTGEEDAGAFAVAIARIRAARAAPRRDATRRKSVH